ncbi:MAG TPA: hypothetical protein VJA26_02775 [Gammaproteobacteria bacterium]|nr:hypothetical protein [Gammaproteobacteria bacterium]
MIISSLQAGEALIPTRYASVLITYSGGKRRYFENVDMHTVQQPVPGWLLIRASGATHFINAVNVLEIAAGIKSRPSE